MNPDDPLNQLLQFREFAAPARLDGDQRIQGPGQRQERRALLFWSLDRLTREGTWMTLCYQRQLSAAGVRFKSYTEQYIDSLGPLAEAIVGIIGAIAQQERLRISERTKAGMARARAAGVHCGRQRKPVDLTRARRLRQQGLTITAIAERMKVSRVIVWRRLNQAGVSTRYAGQVPV